MKIITITALSLAIGLSLALGTGLVQAQYPPPAGAVVLSAGSTTPGLGEEVTVSATVQDETGAAVAGAECTFSIAEQPGDDATVDAGPFTTDSDGIASTTLNSGSTEGVIVVEATCGERSAQVSVVAGDQAAPPGSEPAEPPASLPDTGAEGDAGGIASTVWLLIGAGFAIGLGGLAFAWRRVA